MADALVTKSRMENQKHQLIKRVISWLGQTQVT
jgi:hypothetical protein